jgi:hypothetical protein
VKHSVLFLIVLGLLSPLFFGCSGDDGAVGPSGPAGSPQPIKILFAAADSDNNLKYSVAGAFGCGALPIGTEIDFVSLQSEIPTVSTMKEYDVVLVYTNYPPTEPVLIGDRLAEYVDAGGKLVMTQTCFSTGTGGSNWAITGRIMTEGYSPLWPAAGDNLSVTRTISFASLSFPLHPIFNGTDVRNFAFYANSYTSSPPLDPTATLIALDNTGANAIAISANGSVIALCTHGAVWDNATRPYEGKLMANACLFMGGAF